MQTVAHTVDIKSVAHTVDTQSIERKHRNASITVSRWAKLARGAQIYARGAFNLRTTINNFEQILT